MGHPMQTPGHEPHDTDVRDIEKTGDHASHREWNADRTPPSEVEKGEQLHLAPTVSRGPTVHEKVCGRWTAL
jgi:hypothetical protein